jgi:hypothetical protein
LAILTRKWNPALLAMVLLALFLRAVPLSARQAESNTPEAPQPQPDARGASKKPQPCPVTTAPTTVGHVASTDGASAVGHSDSIAKDTTPEGGTQRGSPCPPLHVNWYKRFTDGPQVKPLTPGEKAWLAVRNLVDPFNLVTILGDSGIAIASNSHSAYGPGMPGFARNVGVSFTQDMTGEFVGTFAIPSIVRQDPHYHRMPHASIPRRIRHAALQILWTQGDNGKGMPNYANIVGFAIDDEISNLYVPGQRTNLPSSAERYGIGLATAPIDNFVSEFVPDIASHIHVQIVVIQRIINQVARTTSSGDTP